MYYNMNYTEKDQINELMLCYFWVSAQTRRISLQKKNAPR